MARPPRMRLTREVLLATLDNQQLGTIYRVLRPSLPTSFRFSSWEQAQHRVGLLLLERGLVPVDHPSPDCELGEFYYIGHRLWLQPHAKLPPQRTLKRTRTRWRNEYIIRVLVPNPKRGRLSRLKFDQYIDGMTVLDYIWACRRALGENVPKWQLREDVGVDWGRGYIELRDPDTGAVIEDP